jgi:hypothetical protein
MGSFQSCVLSVAGLGNVHDRNVVEATSGSFERATRIPDGWRSPKCIADIGDASPFISRYREKNEGIADTRNNWLCYDFKDMRIMPTHHAIHRYGFPACANHLKSWIAETSTDGENWQKVDPQVDNSASTDAH